MMSKTLFDKIWDQHEVSVLEDESSVFYIDRHFLHEVTSPQAFAGLEKRGLPFFRPDLAVATMDHNIPTTGQTNPVMGPESALQVTRLLENCDKYGITLYGMNHPRNGIVHVIGPELGLTQPGMTIVCGDSHTSTHGAFGTIAFGVGTSEVEMVMASQCLLQRRPKTLRITVNGQLSTGVTSKDLILYIISRLGTSAGTGFFVEFAGEAIRSLSMEGRMTVCNMAIEMGARGGLIAPDETTFNYLKGRDFSPAGEQCDLALERWRSLHSDEDATFDREVLFEASDISPMITWGTNPGAGIPIDGIIPDTDLKALEYMGLKGGERLLDKKIDYVFVGSCTNGRIEDLREFAALVEGHKKAADLTAWIVPGSKQVEKQAREEGIEKILNDAGFELRQPGCSACLAMNDDKIPAGKYCISTSNRNFEGRQGPGARTLLASPLTAAAAAVTGKVTDPRAFANSKKQKTKNK
ncbi:MAG: 3-isopropylmalate dehydratase large subunit [Bacteroidia bacterium]|nr:3-isopropylmalate dehydratase large subunit [Bacteroidia bacterium]